MIKERLSPSTARKLLTYPIEKVVHMIENPSEGSPAAAKGNRWEHLLHDPQARREMFKGTATRGAKFRVWADQFRLEVPEYMLETEAEAWETDGFLDRAFKDYLPMCEVLASSHYQCHLESQVAHCYTDFMHESTKTIYEMKVVSKPTDFQNECFRSHYDVQAYIQLMLAGPDWELKWLVVDANAPYTFTLWNCTPEVKESGRQKYFAALHLFERMNAGDYGKLEVNDLEVPKWRLNELL